MPSIKPNESRDAYVSRCIAYVMKNEGVTDSSHAAAKCHGMYDQHLKKAQAMDAEGPMPFAHESDPNNNPLLDEL